MGVKAADESDVGNQEISNEVTTPRPSDSELLNYLWPFFREDGFLLTCGFGGLLLSCYSNAMTPRLIRAIIDDASQDLKSGKRGALRDPVKRALIIFTVGSIGSWYRTRSFGIVAARTARRMRRAVFKSIVLRDKAFFDSGASPSKPAHLIQALIEDVDKSTNSVISSAANILRSTSSLVAGSTLICTISRQMLLQFGAFTLAIVPIVAGANYSQVKRLKKHRNQSDQVKLRTTDFTSERIREIQTVKSFARETHEMDRFETLVAETERSAKAVAGAEGAFMGRLDWTIKCTAAALVAFGSGMVRRGRLSPGSLAAFTMASGVAGMGLVGIWRARAADWQSSTWRVLQYLQQAPERPISGGSSISGTSGGLKPAWRLSGRVEFQNVTFRYPRQMGEGEPVMEGVNLELKAGEILALTGESGSGKSTLGHLFLRLHDPDQGAVLFDGVDAKDLDVAWLREQIGVVGQQTVLFEGTFKENIRYGRLDASDEDIIRAAKEANAHEFIMNNPDGYDSKILIGGKNLSGGQQQRIAIARALVKDPPILLLDEATAALDKAGAEVVHKALLGAMQKRSVLLIAHDDLAVKLANKVVTMCELKHGIAVDPNEDGTQEPY